MLARAEPFSGKLGFGAYCFRRTAGWARYAGNFALSTRAFSPATILAGANPQAKAQRSFLASLRLYLRERVLATRGVLADLSLHACGGDAADSAATLRRSPIRAIP